MFTEPIRILIVDDTAFNIAALRYLLNTNPFIIVD